MPTNKIRVVKNLTDFPKKISVICDWSKVMNEMGKILTVAVTIASLTQMSSI